MKWIDLLINKTNSIGIFIFTLDFPILCIWDIKIVILLRKSPGSKNNF